MGRLEVVSQRTALREPDGIGEVTIPLKEMADEERDREEKETRRRALRRKAEKERREKER